MTAERLQLDRLTVADFSSHIGSAFRMHTGPGQSVEVELIEATSFVHAPDAAPKGRPFNLLFRGPHPACDRLSQQIYVFEHPAVGTMEIFVVPLGPDEKGMRFEAVFN